MFWEPAFILLATGSTKSQYGPHFLQLVSWEPRTLSISICEEPVVEGKQPAASEFSLLPLWPACTLATWQVGAALPYLL
jgi:hypothetical protein